MGCVNKRLKFTTTQAKQTHCLRYKLSLNTAMNFNALLDSDFIEIKNIHRAITIAPKITLL